MRSESLFFLITATLYILDYIHLYNLYIIPNMSISHIQNSNNPAKIKKKQKQKNHHVYM